MTAPFEMTREPRPAFGLDVDDTPTALIVRPQPMSLTFVWFCLLIPLTVTAWFLFARPAPLAARIVLPVMYALIVPTMIGIFEWINAHERREGAFLVLDRTDGTVRLPRSDATVPPGDLLAVVVLKGWIAISGKTWRRVAQLNLLAAGADGEPVRHAALTWQIAEIEPIAEQIATACGVPLRSFTTDVRPPWPLSWGRSGDR